MTEKEISKQITRYINGALTEQEEDLLWEEFLENRKYYDLFETELNLTDLFQNKKFDFNEFKHKVRLQPTALVDCSNREQYKTLIEDIYNYRSRNKVSLRY